MPIKLESTATGGSTGTTVTVSHTVNSMFARDRMMFAAASNWTGGAYGVTGCTFNGVAGKLFLVQSATVPTYLTVWYWTNGMLPGKGAYNIVVSQSAGDCAVSSMLLSGVDQNNPITIGECKYAGVVSPSYKALSADSIVAIISCLSTNTVTADSPLASYASGAIGNARTSLAYIPSPFRASQVSFSGSGDARTNIAYVGLRALAPSRAARYYVAATISPPAAIAAPPTADRLWNRGYVGRIFRRGEKG